jgi:hypothetical protein
MEQQTLNDFFCEALNNVDEKYYRTTYLNIKNIKDALIGRGGWEKENFIRYGERVFCYEFYHQMRIQMDSLAKKGNSLFKDVLLQGEVSKLDLMELVQLFGLEQLGGDYEPDFLLHSPGDAGRHLCVVEVNASP